MTSEPLTTVPSDSGNAASAETGLLLVVALLVVLGVGGMLFMV